MIFLLIYIFILFTTFINLGVGNTKQMKYANTFLLLLFVFLASIRFESGADYTSYEEIFESTSEQFRPWLIEPLFSTLSFIIGIFSKNFNFFLFIIALISITLKFRFINKYSPYIILSTLIYFCGNYLSQDLGQIRQGLAIAFTFSALDKYLENNKKGFYLFTITASLIHYSAMIFILVPLIDKIHFNLLIKISTWVIAFLISFFFHPLNNVLFNLQNYILDPYLSTKFTYLSVNEYNQQVDFGMGMIFRLFLLIISSMTIEKNKSAIPEKYYKQSLTIINLYYFGGLIYFLTGIGIYAGRLSIYFTLIEVILIPLTLKITRDKLLKFILLFVYIIFSITIIKSLVFDSTVTYLNPFKTIL